MSTAEKTELKTLRRQVSALRRFVMTLVPYDDRPLSAKKIKSLEKAVSEKTQEYTGSGSLLAMLKK